jgi:stage II sporulation protein M
LKSSRKRIPFDRLMSRSYWIWRGSPALTVPTMFSTGLTAMTESIAGIFAVAFLVRLEGTSWLARIASDLNSQNLSDLSTLTSSPAFVSLVLEFLLPAVAVSIIVFVLANGFVYSAEYGSYWQAREGAHVGVSDVMSRFVEKWRPMAWTVLLSDLITFLPMLVSIGLMAFIVQASAGLAAALLATAVLLAGCVVTVVFALFFVYTPVAVAADGLSGLAAMRKSWHQVGQNVGVAFAYGVVYFVLTGAISLGSSYIPYVGLPISSLASVGILILVVPVLHLTKTEIYSETLIPEPVEFVVYKSLFPDLVGPFLRMLWRKLVEGLKELKDFAFNLQNLKYHILSAAGLGLGWLLGLWIGNNGLTGVIYGLGYVPGKINPLVTGSLPLTVGVYIFFHNWQASLATALSGVWFPAIPFVGLLLNGILVGVVSDLAPNTTMLAAALLPHGVIELPAFVLAGSAGIKLGVTFLRVLRSPTPEKIGEFHTVTRQTLYLVIGLALLFFIAGFIEGNITPAIMRMAGWT